MPDSDFIQTAEAENFVDRENVGLFVFERIFVSL